ncbi:uncharacterized protein B0H18DRAFT_960623 [Fomitopsis serialis]|uniref:uncharacterized protein n=1 Tax=Fomitopsis serialis TaxID=139415 RepID=UPI002007B5C1|nr:uncharacterized protein B0H18DRAFT_960623 [Neoantrodia serialis]KAH9913052.1 hypothetical protein B0H18DRAFT_960623 [Neoantrodia serialis]
MPCDRPQPPSKKQKSTNTNRSRPYTGAGLKPTRNPIPLPSLHITNDNDAAEVVRVRVQQRPVWGGRGYTWIVDQHPTQQLGRGTLISIQNESGQSGTGRLSSASDLRRHWITFTVAGASPPCNLRVPIPWATLGTLESYTHTTHYATLADLPPPHSSFLNNPAFSEATDNPYEFELWDVDTETLEKRISLIRNSGRRRLGSRPKSPQPDEGTEWKDQRGR